MNLTKEEARVLLDKLDERMSEDAKVLELWNPELKSNGSLRWQWEVDEEDGPMEYLTQDEQPDSPKPNTIYDMLGGWRARECYPKEFVIALLTGELP